MGWEPGLWSANNSSSQCFFLLSFLLCFSVGASHRLQSFRTNVLLQGLLHALQVNLLWCPGAASPIPFSLNVMLAEIVLSLCSPHSCAAFFALLHLRFPVVPATAQPRLAVGSWIQLELAVSGYVWLYSAGTSCVWLELAVFGWNWLCLPGTGCVRLGQPRFPSWSPH